MAKMGTNKFFDLNARATREEDVILAHQKLIGASEWPRPFGCDGLYDGVLIEAKLDVDLSKRAGHEALAQACYYLRRLVNEGIYKGTHHAPPRMIAVIDRNQAVTIEASRLEPFIGRGFNWHRPASSPDPKLVAAINWEIGDLVVYDTTTESGVEAFLASLSGGGTVLQTITRNNFDKIFEVWKSVFAPDVAPQEAALAFLLDLQVQGMIQQDSGRVAFRCEYVVGSEVKYVEIRVPIKQYESFWTTYKRPPSNEEMAAIIERKDRLVVMQLRRTTGEFFTPLEYAGLAHEYLARAIPDRHGGNGTHHSMYDDFNWWDPCCGTGNLTLDCPPNMGGRLFMSTLNQEDVDVIRASGQNPNATIFQFDFLNQGDDELPSELRDALTDGKPWIFILNPPFAAGTEMKAAAGNLGAGKAGVSDTAVGDRMRDLKMGSACQNPMGQFLFRIRQMSVDLGVRTNVGVFSKGILWTGSGLGQFRSSFRQRFSPSGGFCFHSSEFQGTDGAWPVVFTMWKTGASDDDVVVDVFFGPDTVVGTKTFSPSDRPLSKWVDRPKNTVTRPAMNGALGIVERDSVRLDRLSADGIGFFQSPGNDAQHSGSTSYIVSGPHENGCGWSITPANFHSSMVCFVARKLVIRTWLNDRDEFSVPDITHPDYDQWALDAIVWSLFHGSNNTSSLGNVVYKGNTYDIPNHFFWMTPEEMSQIDNLPRPIWQQCRSAQPRFVSTWLHEHQDDLSADAKLVLELGRELVRISAPLRPHALPKFQLDRWDAGFYQVRMGLFGKKDVPFQQPSEMMDLMERFKVAHRELGDRLRPMIYTLGFLPMEVVEYSSRIASTPTTLDKVGGTRR